MMKYYKKIMLIKARPSSGQGSYILKSKPFSLLTLPAMLVGSIVAMAFLSAFIAFLLIPGSILGLIAWRAYKKNRRTTEHEVLSAEYTVLDDSAKK